MNQKDKIIVAATEVFTRKGFEKTTIEEIIREAGCSKGGFYHHFKSKDEVLEHIIDGLLVEIKEYLNQLFIIEYDDFPVKFNQVYDFITGYKTKQIENWKGIKNMFIFSENERVLLSLNRKFSEVVNNIYYKLILKGLYKKEISLDFPNETAELCTKQVLWIYDAAVKTIMNANALDSFKTLLDYSEKLISQQLGLENGQIKYKDCSLTYQKKIIMMHSANEKEYKND